MQTWLVVTVVVAAYIALAIVAGKILGFNQLPRHASPEQPLAELPQARTEGAQAGGRSSDAAPIGNELVS